MSSMHLYFMKRSRRLMFMQIDLTLFPLYCRTGRGHVLLSHRLEMAPQSIDLK